MTMPTPGANPPGLNLGNFDIHMPHEPQVSLQSQEPQPQQPEKRQTYEPEDPWWQASQDRARSQAVLQAASKPEPVAPARVPLIDASANPQWPQYFGALHES